MSSIDLFLPDAKKPLAKPRFVCYEEDWKLLVSVFPETGFASYFPGHLVHILATYLKENDIKSYLERAERPELANLPRFLSDLQLTRRTDNRDDGRGAGLACGQDEKCKGEPTSDAESPRRETEEGKVGKDGEEDRSQCAGPVAYDKQFGAFIEDIIKKT